MAVQNMLIYLQTIHFFSSNRLWGVSRVLWGVHYKPNNGTGDRKWCGTPAFAVLSVLIVNAYKRLGHGVKLTSAYMARVFLLAAVMYVDNIDLLHVVSSATASDSELIKQVQEGTTDWDILAQATGGI